MIDIKESKILNKDLFKKRVDEILVRQTGFNLELESYFCDYFKVAHAVPVTNYSTALDICLEYFQTKNPMKGNVILPSLNSGILASRLIRAGFTPLFSDVGDDFCLSPGSFELRKDLAVACFPCNEFGNLYNHKRINGLPTIVTGSLDVSECVADSSNFMWGDAQIFTFGHGEPCGAFGGAIIATNDMYLADFINYHIDSFLSEIQSAAILTQLESIEYIQPVLYDNYQQYKEGLPDWVQLVEPNAEFSNFAFVPCRIKDYEMRIKLINSLILKGHRFWWDFAASHKVLKSYQHISLPNTDRICKELVCLPNFLDTDVKSILDTIKEIK